MTRRDLMLEVIGQKKRTQQDARDPMQHDVGALDRGSSSGRYH